VNPRERLAQIEAELRSINESAGDNPLTDAQQARWDELMTERGAPRQGETAGTGLLEQVRLQDERRAAVAGMAGATPGIPAAARGTEGGDAATDQAARRQGGARITSEPLTYQRGNAGASYFLDLARFQLRGDTDSRDRLHRHGQEMDVEMPRREQAREARARRAMESVEGADRWTDEQRASVFEQRVAPNTTDGQGGYFVPPLWLVDQYINLTRFGRVTANLCQNFPLPGGTDSVNIPRVTQGTQTGVQTEAGAVASRDLTDDFVTARVRTIAGQEDTSMQVLDQSPVGFDQVIFQDLIADYNMRLDLQCLTGSGTGEHLGILNVPGINAITYTDGTPTLPELYVPVAQAASKVFTGRKLPATAGVFLPAQWYWATSQQDTTGRPLIVPPQVGFNPSGTQQVLAEEGLAGMLSMGVPAYLDGNMPSNLGGGANETRAVVARFPDLFLWEGALRSRVLQEVLSGTLQVRFQVFAYSAFMPHRRPTSISVISGTGMIPAAGF
jgi:HK97 family phage major capsid protein